MPPIVPSPEIVNLTGKIIFIPIILRTIRFPSFIFPPAGLRRNDRRCTRPRRRLESLLDKGRIHGSLSRLPKKWTRPGTVRSPFRGKAGWLLDVEFDEFMGYDKNSHEEKNSTNRRNGTTTKGKLVKTEYGSIVVSPHRDRQGEFEPELIKKRQRVLEGFEDKVIAMYARGFSLADISKTIQEVYSIKLSEETLSNMTKAVCDEVEDWQNRPLDACYPFVYIDCLYDKV